jgi:hypothetical protein
MSVDNSPGGNVKRFVWFSAIALAIAAVMPVSATDYTSVVEMKVKVYATPEQVARIAPDVLEFYGVGEGWFIGAVTQPTYEELAREGFEIDVLVADVRKAAMQYDGFFHTYAQFRDTWAIIAQNFPSICRLDTIGHSANGNLMLAMKISDNVNVMEGEPRICFDFSIHGNENNGCEIAHWALLRIVNGYGFDPDITRWVNEREIWLIPMSNPDGLIARERGNGHGYDCNRNYGMGWDTGSNGGTGPFSEPEVQSFYFLAEDHPMAAWSQYHSGTESSMWPWGYTTKATMDSVVHAYEMQRYGSICGYPAYQISRGLYSVTGGSTDWYYGARGALGYAHEVSDGQPSPPSEIDTINARNWRAMKEQIERVMWGIRGRVLDSVSGTPVDARVTVSPPNWFTYTDSMGYYDKNVHVGTYTVTVEANGYRTKTVSGVVVPADTFAVVNVSLASDTAAPACAFKVITCNIKQSTPNTNPTFPSYALGRSDNVRFSIGNRGWASYDMGAKTPIINGAGSDFNVIEGDADPEACSVYVSNDWNGPWHYVGFGTGTQGYDLTVAGMSTARYVRIADDGNGGSGAYAGFDLDAIEAVVVNAPAIVYQGQTIVDSPPGGNGDGKLDKGEDADLVVALKNAGRLGVSDLTVILRTYDAYVSVQDSNGTYGSVPPDSTRSNNADRFHVAAAANTPQEHQAQMRLYLTGTDYADSVLFTITVGEILVTDPIPDGPRTPPLYWAYDDVDTAYPQHPNYSWVEINSQGTRLTYAQNDDVVMVNLPTGFGPLKFYGQRYTQVSVSADGWIACGNYTTPNYDNTGLPSTSAPRATVFVNWDDLYPSSGGGGAGYVYWYHDTANHRFIVEYDSVGYYSGTERDKFEAIYYDTTVVSPSGDNVVVVQYKTAAGFTGSTVGIQDPTSAIAIQDLFDGGLAHGAAPIAAGRAIKYTTKDPTAIAEPVSSAMPDTRLTLTSLGNPSRGRVAFSYNLPVAGVATLAVYDGTGRLVKELASGPRRAGAYRLVWDGTDVEGRKVGAGVYLIRLVTSDKSVVQKTAVVR